MQLDKKEKESLKYLMNHAIKNSNYELEAIISTSNGDISKNQFTRILARLNSNVKSVNIIERLDIFFSKDSNYDNIRVSIFGFNNINKFCRTEKLEGIKNVLILKKQFVKVDNYRLFIPEYDVKFNLKEEIKIDNDSHEVKDLFNAVKWREMPKIFRYKKIYQYKTNEGFNIDCSVVRSSNVSNNEMTIQDILDKGLMRKVIKPKDVTESFTSWWKKISANKSNKVMVKNTYSFFKSIKESKVLENSFNYEVEVEYVNNMNKTTKEIQEEIIQYIIKFIKYISLILQCIQNSFYILKNSEQQTLFNSYLKMLNSNNKNLFIGALPVDLQHINCVQIPNSLHNYLSEPNITLDYAVCQKIDGERNLMYIANDGECYLISRQYDNIFHKAGIKIPDMKNSLFDGEYLEYDINNEYVNKFIIFDCYVINNKLLIDYNFGNNKTGENTRYYYVKQFEKLYKAKDNNIFIYNDSTKYEFKLDFINYLFGDTSDKNKKTNVQIFEHVSSLLNKMNVKYGGTLDEGHLFSYVTDGLIFMPTNRPLYNFKICEPDNNNKLICNRKISSYFKWKPKHKLTIDFRINFVKGVNKQRIIHYEGGRKYVEIHLRVRNYDSYIYNTQNKNNINSNLSAYILNENRNLYKEPSEILFTAIQPFMGNRDINGGLYNNLFIAYLEINETGNICCKNGDIIYDNDVVEMSYDVDNSLLSHFKKWVPERVRIGKTPNAINTAIDIWKLLHYNLSKDNIMNGLTISDMYNLANNYNLQLYKKPELHKFIDYSKKYLIEKFLSDMTQPRIIDFGCGAMDYFVKYVSFNPTLIIGLDLNNDILNNKKNSAGSNLLNLGLLSPKVKKVLERTLLINADLTKSINTGEAGDVSPLSEYYLDIIYGRYKPEYTDNTKLHSLYNSASSGFNVVVSFNVLEEINILSDDLDMFLYNVSTNLREQGYFIGIFLDGEQIKEMFALEGDRILSGENMTWLLEKNNDVSYMMYYNYYNVIKECYLIGINELESKCSDLGMKLIDSKLLDEDLTGIKNNFKGDINLLMENEENKKWIGLHRYFIFQKSGSI